MGRLSHGKPERGSASSRSAGRAYSPWERTSKGRAVPKFAGSSRAQAD